MGYDFCKDKTMSQLFFPYLYFFFKCNNKSARNFKRWSIFFFV